MEPLHQNISRVELELPVEPVPLNVGPAHPSMHGTCRIVIELSGETVVRCDVQIGYLHRGFEKMCERGDWTQVFPYVDRCNYVSPMLNNVGYALACEKLLGVEVPERCQWYRMALGELFPRGGLGDAAHLGVQGHDAREPATDSLVRTRSGKAPPCESHLLGSTRRDRCRERR